DYQEAVDLPNMERPEALVNYLPTARDLPAFCRAQSRAYDESIAERELELAPFEAKKVNDLDPEILRLPRLYEKLGNLAAYNGDLEKAIEKLETAYRLLNESIDFYPNGKQVKRFMEVEM